MRRFLRLLPVAGLVLAMLTLGACGQDEVVKGGADTDVPSLPDEPSDFSTEPNVFTVTEENPEVTTPEYSIKLSPSAFEGEKTLTVTRLDKFKPFPEEFGVVGARVYDISMEDVHELDGVAELRFPIDGDPTSENNLCAAYFNEEEGEWEPVDWSYEDKERGIVIVTDHFSVFSIFRIRNENRHTAVFTAFRDINDYFRVLYPTAPNTLILEAIVALSQTDGTPAKTLDVVSNVYNTASQYGLDIGYNTLKELGLGSTGVDKFLDKCGTVIGSVGAFFSTWQMARLIHENKIMDAQVTLVETAVTSVISTAGLFLGDAFTCIGTAAFLLAKYIMTTYVGEFMSQVKDKYAGGYALYESEHRYTMNDWFKLIYPIATDKSLTKSQKEERIDKIVVDYCNRFWKLELYDIEEYSKKSMDKGWSDGVLYPSTMNAISEERRSQLYNETMPTLMKGIQGKLREENFKRYVASLKDYAKLMDQKITFRISDANAKKGSKSALEGYTVKFATMPRAIEDPDSWQCTLDENGSGTFWMTVYAYAKNEMKPELVVLDRDGKEVKKVEFMPNPPYTDIVIDLEEKEFQPVGMGVAIGGGNNSFWCENYSECFSYYGGIDIEFNQFNGGVDLLKNSKVTYSGNDAHVSLDFGDESQSVHCDVVIKDFKGDPKSSVVESCSVTKDVIHDSKGSKEHLEFTLHNLKCTGVNNNYNRIYYSINLWEEEGKNLEDFFTGFKHEYIEHRTPMGHTWSTHTHNYYVRPEWEYWTFRFSLIMN